MEYACQHSCFFFKLRFQDDTDSKQVIYVFELAFLFFHFLIDGMNGLGTSFHVEMQSCFLQFLLYRSNEAAIYLSRDFFVSFSFSLIW